MRRMTIAKSPVAPSVSVYYCIQAGGIEELPAVGIDNRHSASGHEGSGRGLEHANASMMRMNSLSMVPGGGSWQQEHAVTRGR
jgi:hypothetical protein